VVLVGATYLLNHQVPPWTDGKHAIDDVAGRYATYRRSGPDHLPVDVANSYLRGA